MSIKDFFEKPVHLENVSTASLKIESNEFALESIKRDNTFQPYIDFSSASNFAKFGSAYEYYTKAIERIYGDYPYDGSQKEKIQFELSSSYLDKYIFDKRYPKSTGYINFSYGGWGNGSPDAQGYGTPLSAADREYIFIRGGLHTASSGMENLPLYKTFEDSVVYSAPQQRTTTFSLDPVKGLTVEFWLRKDAFDTSKTSREVILDLWNNNAPGNDYGRFTLSLNGGSSLNGLNSFQLTFRSGSLASGKGIFEQTVCSSTFHTSSLATWGHYALSVVSESSGLITRFYHNGTLNQKTTHNAGGTMNAIGGRINGYIGALTSVTSHLSPSNQYGGKLSASMDDFRFWKVRRTSEEIYDNWYVHANGGTNTDDANINLGVYYKFNEGIVGQSSIDSNVLDYSGRIINGSWTGYSAGARNTGSAFVSSSLVTNEPGDPIIYKSHSDVAELLTELQTSGSDWDTVNPSYLYHTIPEWIRDEDDLTNSNVKYLYQIISSYFDTAYAQITALPALQNRTYPSASYKALPFAKRLLESKGLATPNLFVDSSLFEKFGHRDENQVLYEEELNEIKNLVYTNIYNNLDFIYKSKGTEKSIRNMLRCFGIDDEIVKLNVYTDGGMHYFNDNYKQTSQTTKYINFNSGSMMSATMFLTASSTNSLSYITGSESSKNEQYSAFTAELDIVVPYKLKMHEKGHFDTAFLSSSIFGMHRPADSVSDYTWRTVAQDIGNFQVYLLRDEIESESARFVLTNRDGTLYLTSSLYNKIYNNQRWNLAVRVKPDKYPLIGNVITSSNPTYNIELYGVTHDYDDVRHEFTLSSSVSYDSGSALLSDSKRFYFGSHLENFTGSVLQQTDMKIGAFRFYMDYLDDSVIKQHNLDPANYGPKKSYQNATLFSFNMDADVPSSDLIAVNYDFSTVTGSNTSGQFIVDDLSSGSSDTIYGWIDAVTRREHRALGYGFPASSTSMVDNEPIFSLKRELPEISYTSNNVFVKGDREEFIIQDDDVSDNYFALEKSMNQVISEEMLKMFSSVKEMNNLVGKAIDRYRLEYKNLNMVRRLFFERNDGDPDFDRFTEYFKWIDKTVSQLVNQLFPASVRHSQGITNVVESHILERNKYQNKFPLVERYSSTEASIKGHAELNYNWKFGHAPLPDSENDNCLWNKEREERSDIGARETIRKVIVNHNNATALSASTEANVVYEASTYAIRKLAKPYSIGLTMGSRIAGGINHPDNKDRDFIHNAVSRHGSRTAIGLPKNVILVGGGTGFGVITPQRCDDEFRPNVKKNLNVDAFVGKYAGAGVTPSPTNENETYNYRVDVSKLPLSVVSQSVASGYGAAVLDDFHDVRITNLHSDVTDYTNEIPMQGPFTNTWVGGHQSRHIDINKYDTTLNDDDAGGAPLNNLHNQYTRAEAWRLLFGERSSGGFVKLDGAFGFTGFDYGGPYPDPARKGATLYRGERAKRPVNIENIKTTTSSANHGNYYENYEVVSSVGKNQNNLYFRNNSAQSNYLPASMTASLPETTHPLTLIANGTGDAGNVFGTHDNNLQPERESVAGVASTTSFFAYGVSGSVDYKYVSHYLQDEHGINIPAPFDVKIEIDNDSSTTFGDEVLTDRYGNSVAYWNDLSSSLNANGTIRATYTVVNADNNYSKGIDCLNSGAAHATLSSSNFTEASSSNAWTLSTWINMSTSSAGGNNKWIFQTRDMTSGEESIEIYLTNAGDLWVYRWAEGSGQRNRVRVADFEDTFSGSWVNLVVTDGGSLNSYGNLKVYVNAQSQSVATEDRTAATALPISGSAFLMSRGDLGTQFTPFNGKFDEITYWKTSLNQANVTHLYNAGIALNFTASNYGDFDGANTLPETSNLISWWSLDNLGASPLDTGDIITDVQGNNNLTVKDQYYDSDNTRHQSYHPVDGIRRAKPMARFDLTSSAEGTAYNVAPLSKEDSQYGFATASVEGVNGLYYYPDASSSFSGSRDRDAMGFQGGVDSVNAANNIHTLGDSLLNGSKNRTIITSRFSAPGGPEVQSKGYLDTYSHEYSVHNALPFRNLTVRGSGSGESGTIRALDIHGNRMGLRTHLQRHAGKFGSDSVTGSVTSADYVTIPSFHKIHRNTSRKPTDQTDLSAPVLNVDHDNAFVQRPIPQSDFQYSWVTASLGSNYSVLSGKQRIFGYAPRGGEVVKGPSYFHVGQFTKADNSSITIGNDTRWNALVGTGNSNNALTLSAWIRITTFSGTQYILSFGETDLLLYADAFGRLGFSVDAWSSGGIVGWRTETEQLEVGRLIHVAVTYDYSATSKDAQLYIDGVEYTVSSATHKVTEISGPPAGTFSALTGDSYMGKYSSNYSDQQLSNVGIWSRVLTSAEILRIYNGGAAPTEALSLSTDLAAYYQFTTNDLGLGPDTSSQILDRSGNNRHSTAVSNVTISQEENATLVEAIAFPSASEIFGV